MVGTGVWGWGKGVVGSVAKAGRDEGETEAEGAVFVVVPVVELGGGKGGFGVDGHVEEAGFVGG